eukprot:GHVU01104007.1.p1 GENE.GHVU01104007.1~~GHVU01104007.1.p1  ORF type:complete len:102 (-),score=1.05 GHVU01104007.1:31-336(-)
MNELGVNECLVAFFVCSLWGRVIWFHASFEQSLHASIDVFVSVSVFDASTIVTISSRIIMGLIFPNPASTSFLSVEETASLVGSNLPHPLTHPPTPSPTHK